MDTALYFRVLRRFKWITIGGLVIATALAFFAMASVSSKGVRYRTPETWEAQTTLLISQRGFSFGRTVFPSTIPPAAGKKIETVTPKWGDEGRLSGLALLYARLAMSDPVLQRLLRSGPLRGNYAAAPIYISGSSNAGTLPMLQVSGFATTRRGAQTIALRATNAFLGYLHDQQSSADIPDDQRVVVQIVNNARKSFLLAGRKKTMPVLIFFAVMSIAIGLAFLLENMRPRVREATLPAVMQGVQSDARRSA